MFDKSYWQAAERFVADDATQPRMCETPGCQEGGNYRAPKSPQDVHNYRWFCLPHVQEYNKSWDFYKGMDINQMEKVRREDIVGWRPTWPLGYLKPGDPMPDAATLKRDMFNRFFGNNASTRRTPPRAANAPVLTAEEQAALTRLGLKWPVSLYEVKQRYRMLVKKHHPDALDNQGADAKQKSAAEELIKLINRAYAVVKKKIGG